MKKLAAVVLAGMIAGTVAAEEMTLGDGNFVVEKVSISKTGDKWNINLGGTVVPLPPVVPTDGLIEYFSFNGNADDSIGGQVGTVVNATLTTGVKGIENTAYYFNGANSKIVLPNLLIKSNYNFSLSFWWNRETSADLYPVVLCDHGISVLKYAQFYPTNGVAWAAGATFGFPAPYDIGTWHHYCVTGSGTTIKLYQDGVLVGTGNIGNANYLVPEGDIWLGMYINGAYPFKGKLDEVLIYNRTLSSNEVNSVYLVQKQ